MVNKLSHLNQAGEARMVDVGDKRSSFREAVARGTLIMKPATLDLIKHNQLKKGDVLAVARVAGILAAKKVPELIPLCHNIPLNSVTVEFDFSGKNELRIVAKASSTGRTGVEMEALTAVTVAALTVYDMCKSVEKGIVITDVLLESKSGGKSGLYERR